jgi:hypothetical protein
MPFSRLGRDCARPLPPHAVRRFYGENALKVNRSINPNCRGRHLSATVPPVNPSDHSLWHSWLVYLHRSGFLVLWISTGHPSLQGGF